MQVALSMLTFWHFDDEMAPKPQAARTTHHAPGAPYPICSSDWRFASTSKRMRTTYYAKPGDTSIRLWFDSALQCAIIEDDDDEPFERIKLIPGAAIESMVPFEMPKSIA